MFRGFCEKDGVRNPFGPYSPDDLIKWANENTPDDLENTRLYLEVISNRVVVSRLHISGVIRDKFRSLMKEYKSVMSEYK